MRSRRCFGLTTLVLADSRLTAGSPLAQRWLTAGCTVLQASWHRPAGIEGATKMPKEESKAGLPKSDVEVFGDDKSARYKPGNCRLDRTTL